jgi:hypothetical protein
MIELTWFSKNEAYHWVFSLTTGQREGEPHITVGVCALHRKAGVGEHRQHGRVPAQGLGGEGHQPPLPGDRHQMLQQQGGDATAVQMIRNSERDLRDTRLTGQLIGRHPAQLTIQPGQQRHVIRPGLPADPLCLTLGVRRAQAEKPQIQVLRRHRGMHLADRVVILRPGRPDLGRTAIGEQRERRRGHVISPAMRPVPAGWPGGTMRAY